MVWVLHGDEPDFCPRCGRELDVRETEDGPRPHCPDCDVTVYANAAVMARVLVHDDDRVLLIERGVGSDKSGVRRGDRPAPDVGAWATPGGHVDAGETAREAAARELEEEAGLAADPDVLRFVTEGSLDFGWPDTYVSFNYALDYAETTGSVDAGSDAADARWWTRDELETDLPAEKNNLRAVDTGLVFELLDAE